MCKALVRAVGIGPANVAVKLGDTFMTQTSELWQEGAELETWSGLRVRVKSRIENKRLRGSWRYTYGFEVIGGVRVLCQWWLNCTRVARLTRAHPVLGAVPICRACNAKVERLTPAAVSL